MYKAIVKRLNGIVDLCKQRNILKLGSNLNMRKGGITTVFFR